ncbi:MAG: pilus assembly protein TadG-related protein, partial [Pseudomonadota bacterium]
MANTRGAVAMTIGVFASVLIAASGMAVDYASLVLQKDRVQSAADAATLLAAREMQVANTSKAQLKAIADQTLQANLGAKGTKYSFTLDVGEDKQTLAIEVKAEATTYFMDWSKNGSVSAKAVAAVHSAGVPLCVLGLSHEKDGKEPGLTLNQNAKLTGEACAVYSNATKKDSIESNSGALLEAGLICTSGGVKGDVDNFNPAPVTDCP